MTTTTWRTAFDLRVADPPPRRGSPPPLPVPPTPGDPGTVAAAASFCGRHPGLWCAVAAPADEAEAASFGTLLRLRGLEVLVRAWRLTAGNARHRVYARSPAAAEPAPAQAVPGVPGNGPGVASGAERAVEVG